MSTSPETSTSALLSCKICSNAARYSYYGAVVCQSCKMFFKRNAETRRFAPKCISNTHCHIDVHSRPMCAGCRLEKCFAVGMRLEMIRAPYSKNRNPQKRLATTSTSTDLAILKKPRELHQIPALNFPHSSAVTLNAGQWMLLSNIVHCFDKYIDNSFGQRFLNEQNALPIKSRFKYSATKDFFVAMKVKLQLNLEKNAHFLSLPSQDRQGLLRSTVEHVTGLGGMFVLRRHQFFDQPLFLETAQTLFRPSAVAFTKHVIDQLDPDETLIKLIIAILSFSTFGYTVHHRFDPIVWINIQSFLSTQHIYTEIAWRYLEYHYGHYDAVRRFSNVIRCLLLVNQVIVEARQSQKFVEIIDTVVKQTEQILVV